MPSRRLTAAVMLALAMIATGVAAANALSNRYTIPPIDPIDEPFTPTPVVASHDGRTDPDLVAPGFIEPQTDFSQATPLARSLVTSLDNAVAMSWNADERVEWASVRFLLPNGDIADISVQALTSVSRPGSHVMPDWVHGSVDGYEAVFEPRDAANSSEAIWVVTDGYQIGVLLVAPPGQRLATPPNSGTLEAIARKTIASLVTR